MQTFLELLRPALAVIVGAGIGYAFGLLQDAALRRNELRARLGQFNNGWSLMPGSGARVALLLVALVLIQFVCPMLFADHTQWWVSGGLLAGYGWTLYRQLRAKRVQNALP